MPRLALLVTLALVLVARTVAAVTSHAAELLEQGIYAEETQGDLPAAIEIYKRITGAADADRPTAAQALVRLGNCYLKCGRKAEATATFDALAKRFPDLVDLLPKVPASLGQRLQLIDLPERTDETCVLINPSGKTSGSLWTNGNTAPVPPLFVIYRITTATHGDRLVSRLETYRHLANPTDMLKNWTGATVHVDRETLQPIDGVLSRTRGRHWQVEYAAGTASVVGQRSDDSEHERQFKTSGDVYDVDSLPYLIRRLPLSEGYEATLPYLHPLNGVQNLRLVVKGRERLSVLAGDFDAYKVQLTWPETDDTQWWFSIDSHHYPLKSEPTGLELAEACGVSLPRAIHVAHSGLVANLEVPPDWVVVQFERAHRVMVHVMAPGMAAIVRVELPTQPSNPRPLEEIAADYLVDVPNRVVRPGWPQLLEVDGRKAIRVLADRSGVAIDHTFARINDRLVTVTFETATARWEALAPTFRAMLENLRFE